MPFEQSVAIRLSELSERGLLRRLSLPQGMDFCSNDYLGVVRSRQIAAHVKIDESVFCGSTGSRALSGNSELIEQLEQSIAEYYGTEAALLFNSGYDANLGLLSSLPQRGETVVYDDACHASIRDGIRLSTARAFHFRHNDLEDLQVKLSHATGQRYVVVESLYSMNGDWAPLGELLRLCASAGAVLIVDEAHANGVCVCGRGFCDQLNLRSENLIRMCGFGKAFGVSGAAIVGSQNLRLLLASTARSFLFTTAMSNAVAYMLRSALEIIPRLETERSQLRSAVALFRSRAMGLTALSSAQESPIQIIRIQGNSRVQAAASALQSRGFDIRAIRSPTVPVGQECLRLVLHSYNVEAEVSALVLALREVV